MLLLHSPVGDQAIGTGPITDARLLIRALTDPASPTSFSERDWTALIAMARAEQLVGSLVHRLGGLALPEKIDQLLADARSSADHARSLIKCSECLRDGLRILSPRI